MNTITVLCEQCLEDVDIPDTPHDREAAGRGEILCDECKESGHAS